MAARLREWLRCLSVYGTSMVFSLVMLPPLTLLLRHWFGPSQMASNVAAAILTVFTVAGSYFGGSVAVGMTQRALQRIFGITLMVLGGRMLLQLNHASRRAKPSHPGHHNNIKQATRSTQTLRRVFCIQAWKLGVPRPKGNGMVRFAADLLTAVYTTLHL